LYFMGVSVPLQSNGFVANHVESRNRRKCQNNHDRIDLLRRHVQTNPEVDSSKERTAEGNTNKWWEDVTFEYGHVAERCLPDFKILTSTTTGDDVNAEAKNGEEVSDDSTTGKKKQLIYLDSGATSQKPNQVIRDTADYYERINSNVHRGAHTLSRLATEAFEDGRDAVASFVNANSRNEIVFTSGATEAINLVAASYSRAIELKKGDEILLTEMEHHSNLVPWQLIAQQTGATLRFVRVDFEKTGGLDLDHMETLLNENTKIVSFQHVSNVMACINPVKEMVAMVRAKASPNAVVVLDACQSIPHMKVDVQSLGVDFLAASGHKMCGPTGIGFLWGREDILNSMPPYMGGGEMIDQVTLEGSTFAPAPARFEAGTPPIAEVVGLASAIRYLDTVGMDNVEAYEHEIASYLYNRLSEVDKVTVLGPSADAQRAALCAFYVDGVHPSDLSTFLDMEGVAIRAGHHCCQPLHQVCGISHSARASLYIYNTKNDVDSFIEHLENTIAFFTGLENKSDEKSDDHFVPFI